MRTRIESAVIILLTVLTLAGIHFTIAFLSPVSRDFKVKTVMVEKGASFRAVALSLEKEGLIRDAGGFSFAAKIFGAYKKIRAGEYELSPSMTPVAILDSLTRGRVKRYAVTIPEGYNVRDAASAIAATGLVDEKAFVAKAMDARFAASLGVEGSTLEGYLFPDTYHFERGQTVEDMLSMMFGRFKKVYEAEFAEEARQKGFTMKKLITLASIIEKETGAASERPAISSVFQNRLKKRIRLQSDPTVIYGIKAFDGNLTKRHLQTRTPYNTYTNFGLPPGPIANPGKDSIRAALNPAKEEYLYFVSMNNGSHYFSKSLREHNNAVNTYQRRRGRRGDSLCSGTNATLDCLSKNFEKLYSANHPGFWDILHRAEKRAQQCSNVSDVVHFLVLVHLKSNNAEFNEFFNETIENMCVKNNKCFLDALVRLKEEDLIEIVNRLRSPIFIDQAFISDAFIRNKDNEKYKRIVERYLEKKRD